MYYKLANLHKRVLRTLQIISLLAASLTLFSNLFHILGSDTQKDFSPYIAVWLFLNRQKWTGIRSEHSHWYIFVDQFAWIQLVPFSSLLWMCGSGSCTVIWNVREAWNKTGVICSLLRVRVTRRAAQFCTRSMWFVRDGGGGRGSYRNYLP